MARPLALAQSSLRGWIVPNRFARSGSVPCHISPRIRETEGGRHGRCVLAGGPELRDRGWLFRKALPTLGSPVLSPQASDPMPNECGYQGFSCRYQIAAVFPLQRRRNALPSHRPFGRSCTCLAKGAAEPAGGAQKRLGWPWSHPCLLERWVNRPYKHFLNASASRQEKDPSPPSQTCFDAADIASAS